MKYSLIGAILVAFTLTACGDPKPGQYPPGFMDEREGMDELDATLSEATEAVEQEESVLDTIEDAIEDAIDAVEDAVEDAVDAVEDAFDDTEDAVEEAADDTADAVEEAIDDAEDAIEEAVEE